MAGQSHTAGPIARDYTNDASVSFDGGRFSGGGSYITLVDGGGRPLAFVLGEYVPGELDPEMDANASLYAAAPELLEALRRIASGQRPNDTQIGMREDGNIGPIPCYMTASELQAIAASAIAKATGEGAS